MHESELLKRPIIIIGSPRSGTTLTGQILRQHRDLAYLEEPRLTWRYGNHSKSDMLHPDDARPEVISHIRTTFIKHVADKGKLRLLEKTPSNALRLPFIDKVFPDAIYIHTIRNGYDSVLSIRDLTRRHATGMPKNRLMTRMREVKPHELPRYGKEVLRRFAPWLPGIGKPVWGPRIPGIDGLMRDLHPLEVAAIQWCMCVELACHFGRTLPPERYLEIRLEEMSESQINRIIEFTGLDPDPSLIASMQEQFNPNQSQQRVKTADPNDIAMIEPWITSTMAWLEGE